MEKGILFLLFIQNLLAEEVLIVTLTIFFSLDTGAKWGGRLVLFNMLRPFSIRPILYIPTLFGSFG